MKDEIDKADKGGKIERTFDGERVRSTREQVWKAFAPMFAMFPNAEMKEETFNVYYMMLADLDADMLVGAVMRACRDHEYPTQLVTVAAIRRHLPENREPGPRSDSENNYLLPPPPPGGYKMFRLSAEEDRQQRMELLRQTSKWDSKYAR